MLMFESADPIASKNAVVPDLVSRQYKYRLALITPAINFASGENLGSIIAPGRSMLETCFVLI